MNGVHPIRALMMAMLSLAAGLPAARPVHAGRLLALARLDGAVHRFHPIAATRPTNWDAAFARYAPSALNARNPGMFRAAVDSMLAALGDPATYRIAEAALGWQAHWRPDSTLLIVAAAGPTDTALATKARLATAVILDLRDIVGGVPEALLGGAVLEEDASAPPMRALHYHGLQEAVFPRAGDVYRTTWRRISGEQYRGSGRRAVPVVVLANARSVIPGLVLALRSAGSGAVIGVGTRSIAVSGTSARIAISDSVSVNVRLGQRDGLEDGLTADTVVTDPQAALRAVRVFVGRRIRTLATPSSVDTLARVHAPMPTQDLEWSREYPSAGYRLLASARLWSAVHYFFPYKESMDTSWDSEFCRRAPAILQATNALAYADAIRDLVWGLHDSHVSVGSAATARRDFEERVPLPISARMIQDSLTITRDASLSGVALHAGDVVTAIQRVPVRTLVQQLTGEIVWSTAQGLRRELPGRLLTGKRGRWTELTVRDGSGIERVVRVTPTVSAPAGEARGPAVRLLPGNIAHVDLVQLTVEQVDRALATVASARALIFDMRGYPRGTGETIAARLSQSDGTVAALYRIPDVSTPNSAAAQYVSVAQRIPSRRAAPYQGRTVMLVDERTMSQAEHTGLLFVAANGTTLIGSSTVGANGNVTNVVLPGKVQVRFTGMDVRFPDGRPLQRVGLQPAIRVSPTVRGVREGRDEVLDAARQYLARH